MTIIVIILLLFGLLVESPVRGSTLDTQLDPIVKPYLFSIARWEFKTLAGETLPSLLRRGSSGGDPSVVLDYFESAEQARTLQYRLDAVKAGYPGDAEGLAAELDRLREHQAKLEGDVERILEWQIRQTAAGLGINNPFAFTTIGFPPVDFKLTKPPNLLVISPRDRIESVNETMLQPDLTVQNMEEIEMSVDRLSVSSLVTGIGGLGATYPTFVANGMSLRSTIDAATEEWLHQYLAFRPIGFLYVLDLTGVAPNYDIARMNETLAGIVSKEIGALVYDRYYGAEVPVIDHPEAETGETSEEFDFNGEMREIRKTVDLMLGEAKIEEAEQFMNDKRDYLAENGYYIRKLNQAYFAFHGAYADSPTSIDPIGAEMKTLRTGSASLREFLERVSTFTSRQALSEAAEGQAK